MKSLPASSAMRRAQFHGRQDPRWLSSVNAIPGGSACARRFMTKSPARSEGASGQSWWSATSVRLDAETACSTPRNAATDIILTEMMRFAPRAQQARSRLSDKIDRDYFENYRGQGLTAKRGSSFTDPDYLTKLIGIVWGKRRAQAAGRRLRERRTGWRTARARHRCLRHREQPRHPTPRRRRRSRSNKQARLDYRHAVKDGAFDFVFETKPLPYFPKQVVRAIKGAEPRWSRPASYSAR